MKKKSKMIRTGLVALLLSTTASVFGQAVEGNFDKPPIPVKLGSTTIADDDGRVAALTTRDGVSLDSESQDVVLFYNPSTSGPSLWLVASKTEDHSTRTGSNALAFTKYVWSYMGKNPSAPTATAYGTVIPIGGLTQEVATNSDAHKVEITQLSEGYHVFKVEGYIIPEGANENEICAAHEEYYVIYVLPELAVTATGSTTGTSFQYCETEATAGDGQTKVNVDAVYDFVRPNTPDAADFGVKYRWYSVKQNETGWPDVTNMATDPISLGPDAVRLLLESETDATGGTLPSFAPQISTFGNYKIFVEVEYTVKDRNYSEADAGDVRVRSHVIYRGFAKVGTEDMILTVTPAPGKPHITILDVTD